jgi:hypothetical protein
MDLVTGQDGGVYIADWSDTGECHDHDGVHRTSGRIYKLTHGRIPPKPAVDLYHASNQELIAHLFEPNAWWPRTARRILTERFAGKSNEDAAAIRKELAEYSEELGKRPEILAITKAELPDAKGIHEALCENLGRKDILIISAVTGQGLNELVNKIATLLAEQTAAKQ